MGKDCLSKGELLRKMALAILDVRPSEIAQELNMSRSQTHMSVRQDIVDSDKKLVEKTINQAFSKQPICFWAPKSVTNE